MNKTAFKRLALITLLLFISQLPAVAYVSQCVKYDRSQVKGTGPLPYNYRVIDGKLHAGGHPLDPVTGFKNTDEQALSILKYLKAQGVVTVIDLQNDKSIEARYVRMLEQVGIQRLHVPLTWLKTPDKAQWSKIKEALKSPVYIHCKWGMDRTGLVIAKYLVENKGYSVNEAWKALETGGSHAGTIRGMHVQYRYDPVFLSFLKNK